MRQHGRIGVAAVLVLIAAGCGGDGIDTTQPTDDGAGRTGTTTTQPTANTATTAGESGGPSTGTTADVGECTIVLSGDITESLTHPQSEYSFTSDYWLTADALQEALDFFDLDEDYEDYVARGEPVTSWLLFNCVDRDNLENGVLVAATNTTNPDQFPLGPGTYPVSGGLFDADGPAGTVIANLGHDDALFDTVEGSGELIISRWDGDRLEGTVSFEAYEIFTEGDPQEVSVRVDFTYRCHAPWHSACG